MMHYLPRRPWDIYNLSKAENCDPAQAAVTRSDNMLIVITLQMENDLKCY